MLCDMWDEVRKVIVTANWLLGRLPRDPDAIIVRKRRPREVVQLTAPGGLWQPASMPHAEVSKSSERPSPQLWATSWCQTLQFADSWAKCIMVVFSATEVWLLCYVAIDNQTDIVLNTFKHPFMFSSLQHLKIFLHYLSVFGNTHHILWLC